MRNDSQAGFVPHVFAVAPGGRVVHAYDALALVDSVPLLAPQEVPRAGDQRTALAVHLQRLQRHTHCSQLQTSSLSLHSCVLHVHGVFHSKNLRATCRNLSQQSAQIAGDPLPVHLWGEYEYGVDVQPLEFLCGAKPIVQILLSTAAS